MGIARPRYDRHGQAVYRSPRWGRVRFLVKRRDQWRCVKCGAAGCRLEVDHIRPIREAPELAYDMGNLQTLCVPCHSRKTQKEVGFYAEMKPERQAWRKLVRELARPYRAKETANA